MVIRHDTAVLLAIVHPQRDRVRHPHHTGHLHRSIHPHHTDLHLQAGHPLRINHRLHTDHLHRDPHEGVFHLAAHHPHPGVQRAIQEAALLRPPTDRLQGRSLHHEVLPQVEVDLLVVRSPPRAFLKGP